MGRGGRIASLCLSQHPDDDVFGSSCEIIFLLTYEGD